MFTDLTSMPHLDNPLRAERFQHHPREQTRWQAAIFFGKAWVFRVRRFLADVKAGRPVQFSAAAINRQASCFVESRSLLYSSERSAEFRLQAGKVQNLRVAAARLNGIVIPAGEIFSFWAQLGRPTHRRGFAPGRELREGCVIPSIGGGLCQISNALFDAALQAGCEIVERHAHSQKLPGSMAVAGRDATVFWNYVDLRFRHKTRCQLEVCVTRRELIVRLHLFERFASCLLTSSRSIQPVDLQSEADTAESCETCGVTECFRHVSGDKDAHGITAWLVDASWPEFDEYLQKRRAPEDWLLLPLDGARWKVDSYRWKTLGFAQVRQAPWEVLLRSLKSRRLATQGAERQEALLHFDESLARRFARALPYCATHLVVSQTLLPFLWRDGVLGGRTFDVLMTRLPMEELQKTLDTAHLRHPESRTLADFRGSPGLVSAENAALAAARHWITPHTAIAKLGGARSVVLDWILPTGEPLEKRGTRISFPASTLGRKGAYEVREVARRLGLQITLGGPVIEDARFWDGLETVRSGEESLMQASVIVLPAWVEHQPRRLLRAVAAGVPVVASQACGLEHVPGVISIDAGDTAALESVLRRIVCLRQDLSPAEPASDDLRIENPAK